MNRTFAGFAGLVLGAGTLAFVSGCLSSSSAQSQQTGASSSTASVTRISATAPVRKTLRRESVQPGQIEAFETTGLLAKLPAYVGKLHVDIGDRVEADQLLVELYLPELKDELRQKEAAVAQAQAEIELAGASVRAAEAAVATAQANVSAAEAGNIRAEADLARWQSQSTRISQLVKSNSVDRKLEDETLNLYRAAEAARGEARAKVEAAKASLAESQAGVAKAKASEAVARARHGNAKADLSRANTLLEYTQIRAPYAGVITERNVNRGDFVQPASMAAARPLLSVARTDTVRIFVDVSEMDSPWVEAGRPGYVSVQALPDRIVQGKVARTSWVLGPNRTLRTELDLANPSGVLRPGMYVTAHIVLEESPNGLVIPMSAVVGKAKEAFCWVAKEGRALRTRIALGLEVGNEVEVASGLKGDELVIQTPPGSLQDGQRVEVAKSEEG